MSDVVSAIVQPSETQQVHQGRWGYYQVDQVTCRQIKKQHKQLFATYIGVKKALRHYRKTFYRQKFKPSVFVSIHLEGLEAEKYRVSPAFIAKEAKWDFRRTELEILFRTFRNLYLKYLAHYRAARKPWPTHDIAISNIASLDFNQKEQRLIELANTSCQLEEVQERIRAKYVAGVAKR